MNLKKKTFSKKKGGDLDVRFKKLKKENKRLSETQILDWFIQLLSAIHYMHSRRVLHRDLKARYLVGHIHLLNLLIPLASIDHYLKEHFPKR
jgi:serine/threonine protein kinase